MLHFTGSYADSCLFGIVNAILFIFLSLFNLPESSAGSRKSSLGLLGMASVFLSPLLLQEEPNFQGSVTFPLLLFYIQSFSYHSLHMVHAVGMTCICPEV